MSTKTLKYSRLVLTAWSLALIAGFGALAAADYGMLRYAEYRNSRDYQAVLAEATIHIKNEDFVSAQQLIRRAFELAPEESYPHVVKGHFHYHRREWQAAIDAYLRAIELGSGDEGIWQNIVWAYVELEAYEEGGEFGEKALLDGRTAPRLPLYTAEAWLRARAFKKASIFYRAALALEPNNTYLMERLRVAYERDGDQEAAAGIARRIAELNSVIEGGL